MSEAVILSCVRSPLVRANKGSFVNTRIDDIAARVLARALALVPGLPPDAVEDLLVGCAFPEGEQGLNVSRNIALLAGLPPTTAAATINRYCASSMEAVAQAARAVACGDGDLIVAGGIESMTHIPIGGFNTSMNERLTCDGAPDAYIPMGLTAENVAREYGISREEQDRFALASHRKAVAAQGRGAFDAEIVPVEVNVPGGGSAIVASDEGPRPDTSMEALANLKPAFLEGGTVTAGNSSPMTDGAAMVVIASKGFAKRIGAKSLARIRAAAVAGVAPEVMGLGPIAAVPKVLIRAGMKLGKVDLIELNEAFAAQAIACVRELGIDESRLNVNGGAVALGHPLGASGARIVTTLVHGMTARGVRRGLATMCVGGGQGMAIILERP